MSLARISQRLAAARQSAGTAVEKKEEEIEDCQVPQIRCVEADFDGRLNRESFSSI